MVQVSYEQQRDVVFQINDVVSAAVPADAGNNTQLHAYAYAAAFPYMLVWKFPEDFLRQLVPGAIVLSCVLCLLTLELFAAVVASLSLCTASYAALLPYS